jgi:non-specific serine/threonine protein kinase
MKSVRIFISSPGDVAAERLRALSVIERLQQEFDEALVLEPLLEEPEQEPGGPDIPSRIHHSPADSDIFVTIVGGHLESPPDLRFRRKDGSSYASRTEFQFEIAIDSARSRGKPELLVYRKSLPAERQGTPEFGQVSAFFDKWFLSATDRTAIGAYHTFAGSEQFEDLFTLHLRKLLRRFLPRPNNLPASGTSFVGRTDLIREITGLIKQSEVRLVTLAGPGGAGKSRLALRVASGLLPDFEDGIFLVTLAALRQADLVPGTIATTLGIKQNDNRPVIESVVDALHKKEMLLLIDNLEQVQSAVSHINTLVSKCPGVKVLLTSREALRISGARTIRVPPFALPDPKKASFAQIRDSESVQLFVDRARTVRADFELGADNAREVLQICHRLDGLPLAIELATSRMRSMSTAELLRSMEQRFAVLEGEDADLLDHHRNLRELISWSYDLLTEDEQTLWRRMAVFTGGFAMEAAEDVCDPDDDFVVDIEVEGLVDKSLATLTFKTGENGNQEARVNMLDTLREFALQKLEEVGEYRQFRERFCDWVVELAESSVEELRGANSDSRIGRLDLEQINLQAAIDYCRGLTPPDWDRALRVGGGVWLYWFERGMLSTSRELFEHAMMDIPGVDDSVRALPLRALGSVARFQNDLETAERACKASLEIYTRLDDAAGQGNVLGELGAIAQRQGNMEKAADHLDKALQLFERAPDDLHGRSFAAAARGVINHLEGDLKGARAFYEAALETGSKSGDTDSIASALVNLGEVEEAEGDYEKAYSHYTNCLGLYAQRGKKVAIAYCAEIIAGLSTKHRKRPSDAAMFFGFADALRKEIESPIESFNAERLQADIKVTESAMTPDTFKGSWDAGASLDIDEFLTLIKDLELSN